MTIGDANLSTRAPSIHADVVVDSTLAPGTVELSAALLLALRVENTRTLLWDEPTAPDTEEERLLRAIFGGAAEPTVTVRPVGPVRGGDMLVKTDFGQLTFVLATSGSVLSHQLQSETVPGNKAERRRHVFSVQYFSPAGPGDVVVDARGTRAHVVGVLGDVTHHPGAHDRDHVLGAALDAINLAQETRAALENSGVATVAALVRYSKEALQTRAGLSAAALANIEAALAEVDLLLPVPVDVDENGEGGGAHGNDVDPQGAVDVRLVVACAVALVAPFTLVTPTASDQVVARSIGRYAISTERPLDAAVMTRAQRHALHGVAPALAEEVTWRSDNPHGRLQLFETLAGGRDPRGRQTPMPTRAFDMRNAFLSLLGFGLDIEAGGVRFVATHLGRNPRPHVPTVEPLTAEESTSASPATAASPPRALALSAPVRALRGDEAWSYGAIQNTENLDVTGLPIFGGLFCQRIFGPVNNFACACRQRVPKKERGTVCKKCGVDVLSSLVRNQRYGHIALAHPVIPWPWRQDDELVERGFREPGALRDAGAWHVLPVIPPGFREIVKTADGTFCGNFGVNDLYGLVWRKNQELAALTEADPHNLVVAARRGLQQAVDALLLSGLPHTRTVFDKSGRAMCGAVFNMKTPPLRDTGVDFAAQATVVTDAGLTGRTLAVGEAVAREVWKYRVMTDLTEHGRARTFKDALVLWNRDEQVARNATEHVVCGSAVLCAAHASVCGAVVVNVDPGAGMRASPELMRGLGLSDGERLTVHLPLSRASALEASLLTAREAPPLSAAPLTKQGFVYDLASFLEEGASLDDLSALLLENQGVLDTTSEELGGLLVTGLREEG